VPLSPQAKSGQQRQSRRVLVFQTCLQPDVTAITTQSKQSKQMKNPTNMNNYTNTNSITQLSLALAVVLTVWFPVQSRSAEPAKEKMKMEGKMMTETTPVENCQAMKDQMEKIMADTQTQNAELTTQIAAMNSAPEEKKLDMMAALVTRMAEQQTAMHSRRADMEKMMVPHMMQHMKMGKESMSTCPMMQGMQGTHGMHGIDAKSADDSEAKPSEKQ